MEKKILLAVDNSRNSRNAIHYAVGLSSFVKNLHYVLFHVQPVISLFLKEEAQKSLTTKSKLESVVLTKHFSWVVFLVISSTGFQIAPF